MHVQFTADAAAEPAAEVVTTLDELARQGGRQMIALALQLEVAEYVAQHAPLHDEAGRRLFREEFGVKDAKAVACLLEDEEGLLTFMQFPPEHWVHLRTTNPIEATFAATRGRAQKTKGAGSRKAGLAMAFKLIESAQPRGRKIKGPEWVPLVRKGSRFPDGQ